MPASNTMECFETFIGHKVVGVLEDTFPLRRLDLARGTRTILFEDGRGLTISANGAFWVESKEEVDEAKRQLRETLSRAGVESGLEENA